MLDSRQNFKIQCSYCENLEMFDLLNDAMLLIKDDDNKTILYINAKARQMYGYTVEEAESLSLFHIICDKEDNINTTLEKVKKKGDEGFIYITCHRKKDRNIFNVQVNVKYIRLYGQDVFVALVRDATTDMLLKEDVLLAGKIQRQFLPPNLNNQWVEMRGIYQPFGHISGDLYGYVWLENRCILFGYIIDVMGHGLATALQAATLRVLFQEVATIDLPLNGKLEWLNGKTAPYFVDDSFAATICFEMDFRNHVLTYAAGGINHFLAKSGGVKKEITVPGMFLGISKNAQYEQYSLSFESGDSFYFLTDGLFDMVNNSCMMITDYFKDTCDVFSTFSKSKLRRDDASAICFLIK